MTTFKWFASLVLATNHRSRAAGGNPLPRKCRKCTLPPRKPPPDDPGGIHQPFRSLQLSPGYRNADHDGRSFSGRRASSEALGRGRGRRRRIRQSASYAQLDLLEAGSHAVANQKVLVYGLQNLHGVDLHIRGILGEDFLEHFDMLIDNAHRLLCLDDSAAMRTDVKGPHIALIHTDSEPDRQCRVADHLGASIRCDAARSPDARLRRQHRHSLQHL